MIPKSYCNRGHFPCPGKTPLARSRTHHFVCLVANQTTVLVRRPRPKPLSTILNEEQRKLAEKGFGLVRWQAARMRQHWVSDEDLISEGTLGLIRAAELHDPNLGFAFSTFAVRCIKTKMLHAIRKAKAKKIRNKEFNISLPEGCDYDREQASGRLVESIAAVWPRDNPLDADGKKKFDRLLSILPKSRQQILLEKMAGYTLEEIGKRIGISRSRVGQLFLYSLSRLRSRVMALEIKRYQFFDANRSHRLPMRYDHITDDTNPVWDNLVRAYEESQ